MRPVCVQCGKEMECIKNGVTVYHPMEPVSMTDDNEIDFVVSGDKYQCPVCKIEIVTGFGRECIAGEFSQQWLRQYLDRSTSVVEILRS